MLRYKTETRPGLVALSCMTSVQETERVNSYNPGARTGILDEDLHITRLLNSLGLAIHMSVIPRVVKLHTCGTRQLFRCFKAENTRGTMLCNICCKTVLRNKSFACERKCCATMFHKIGLVPT